MAEVDLHARRQPGAATRFHIPDGAVCRSHHPFVRRKIFQAPPVRILRMRLHRRQRLRQIIKPLRVKVVRIQLSIVIEQDHVAAQTQPERQGQRSPTVPADAGLAVIRPQRFTIVEVLRAAVAAVENRIA